MVMATTAQAIWKKYRKRIQWFSKTYQQLITKYANEKLVIMISTLFYRYITKYAIETHIVRTWSQLLRNYYTTHLLNIADYNILIIFAGARFV